MEPAAENPPRGFVSKAVIKVLGSGFGCVNMLVSVVRHTMPVFFNSDINSSYLDIIGAL